MTARLFLASVVGMGVFAAEGKPQTVSTVAVGLEKQLFVDDWVVSDHDGVTWQLGGAVKANGGRPVFTGGRFYGTVLHEEGRFKLWYRRLDGKGFVYNESPDGLRWQKKGDVVGIPFAGDYSMSVEIDPNARDPSHRFMAAFDAVGMAAGVAHSADGIHWEPYNDGKPVTGRAADTYNQIVWDAGAGTYRLFTRTDIGTPGGTGEIRGTRSMVNPNVKENPTAWQTVRSWHFDREGKDEHKRRQIYALTDWIYHGVHFALMTVFEWPEDTSEGPADLRKRHERDVMNFYIATSRNGDDWDLRWVYAGQAIVERGRDGAFDKDMLMPASTVVTYDDQHWLYYCGWNERHGTEQVRYPRTAAIGLATLRLDGFVYLEAGDTTGTVTTKPFRLEGSRLAINVDAGDGWSAVEVLDAKGKTIDGFSREEAKRLKAADGLRLEPTWNKGAALSTLKGRTIVLRFLLHKARLYSFQVLK